jgi:hypothetical protein
VSPDADVRVLVADASRHGATSGVAEGIARSGRGDERAVVPRPRFAVADDAHAVGGEEDGLVLLVPTHAVALVTRSAQDLDDLAATAGPSVDPAGLEPVAGPRRECGLRGGLECAPTPSKPLPDARTSAVDAHRDAEIYGCASL